MTRLFLYGTLRAGQRYHHLLDGRVALDTVVTEAVYSMVDMGGYPALLEGGRTAIVGEVYDVDTVTLARLDLLEETPEFYRRVPTVVAGYSVQLYVLPEMHAAGAVPIDSGDWCAWVTERR